MGPKERQLSKVGKLAPKDPSAPSARERRFRELYVSGMTAVDAAKHAGYSKLFAEKKAWLLARACKLAQKPALYAAGLDEIRLAREVAKGLEAMCSKWNPELKRYEMFEDNA